MVAVGYFVRYFHWFVRRWDLQILVRVAGAASVASGGSSASSASGAIGAIGAGVAVVVEVGLHQQRFNVK